MAEEKIKRSAFAQFLNTTPGESTATYARMGKGITTGTLSYNANTTTETYIHEDNASSSIDSYAPELATQQTCFKGEPIFEYIDELRKKRATGSDCETDMLLVYIYDKTGNNYAAEKQKVVIELSDFGGDGGGNVVVNYNVKAVGDPTLGTATITDGAVTFAETTAAG